MPVLEELNLPETLFELRRKNIRCIAAHPHAAGKVLPQIDLRGSCCLVLGNEADGISREVLAACDEAVAVPMATNVDSLNVSSAGGLFLYEVWRQRFVAGNLARMRKESEVSGSLAKE